MADGIGAPTLEELTTPIHAIPEGASIAASGPAPEAGAENSIDAMRETHMAKLEGQVAFIRRAPRS